MNERLQLAIESILENESLTADLEDAAATELIDWGTDCAEKIVQRTTLDDTADVDAAIETRLKAVRKMMRLINAWIANRQSLSGDEDESMLNQVIDQVKIIYGENHELPAKSQQRHFLRERLPHSNEPVKMVLILRMLIEDQEDYRKNN
ncbi:hypothetical protein GF337_08250 [candidate division KSB1 bacterium]|nr:hypothetical protein [candidate division KSB1 bacterium]